MYCFSQRLFKRQASVFFFFSWMIVDVVADRKSINPESLSLNLKTKSEDSNQTIVFYCKSSESVFDFHKSLNFMIEEFEVREEMLITPNKYPKILLKIDSATAPGLHISIDLLDGLLELLKSRGYAKERVELLFLKWMRSRDRRDLTPLRRMAFIKDIEYEVQMTTIFTNQIGFMIVRCLQRCTIEQNFIYDFQTTVKSV